jgi:predicted ATP-dependent endonuclease of OLD family
MILKTIQITNYKCIFDSGKFTVSDVTALVGKNESGKSALLQALYKLNPVEDSAKEYSDIEEFPRSKLSEYEEIKEKESADVISTEWELSTKEIVILEASYGKECLSNPIVEIKKKYNNIPYYTIHANNQKILEYLKKNNNLGTDISTALQSAQTIDDYFASLETFSKSDASAKEYLDKLLKLIPGKNIIKGFTDQISAFLPKFLYFADYNRLPGMVSLEAINQRIAQNKETFEDKVFLALLGLVGTDIKTLQGLATFEQYIAKLEAVSLRLTKEIFEYWSQNKHLEVEFRFDAGRPADPPPFNTGFVFRTRIKNKRHGVTVSFDDRSTGFVWFFSFLVYFSQLKKNYGEQLFILLDEPGLSLHAKAQADFLRYITEKIAPQYQVIYTTHSPFLIDQEKIINVRTVEDKDINNDDVPLGTKVGEEILSVDKDTILPLQAAFGYEITQTLFIGPNTILVEGPSDLLYMKFFSRELKMNNREYLDPRWTIAPTGGIDKVASFVTLFNSQKLNIAVVTDFHKGDKKKVESLKERRILESGHVFSINSILNVGEADIEDMLGKKLYIDIVNDAYALSDDKKIVVEEGIERIINFVEEKFRTIPSEINEFDHYFPSAYLISVGEKDREKYDFNEALQNFELLFKQLNALLK